MKMKIFYSRCLFFRSSLLCLAINDLEHQHCAELQTPLVSSGCFLRLNKFNLDVSECCARGDSQRFCQTVVMPFLCGGVAAAGRSY